ncbi:MAG: hypothetical protein FWD34_00325 [Oscillospiraceae bacterium]|nr:hypothetical protein [Oscillospiraceae bacterium]
MNTFDRNEKNVKKMQDLGQVYSESDEDRAKEELQKDALENATREFPLLTLRKVAAVVCGGFWLFSIVGIFFGIDFRATMPFMFFSLSVLVFLNVPVFYMKKKNMDFVIAIVAGIVCLAFGLSLMTIGGR